MVNVAENRFAMSALSRNYKGEALPEEILVEKETGQILIKTANGDIISHDSLSRLRNRIDSLTNFALLSNIRGDMFSIELDNIEFPAKINDNENLLLNEVIIKNGSPKRFLISIDVDTLELSQSDSNTELESQLIIDLEYSLGLLKNPVTITGNVSEISQKIINASDYFPSDVNLLNHTLIIKSIKVQKNASYGIEKQLKHIMHNMLIIVE